MAKPKPRTIPVSDKRHLWLKKGALEAGVFVGPFAETVLDAGQKALAAAKKEGK